jgi:hypothetical protein
MTYNDHYWIEVDPETNNPTGNVCWAYWGLGDKPEGYWIMVKRVEIPDKD